MRLSSCLSFPLMMRGLFAPVNSHARKDMLFGKTSYIFQTAGADEDVGASLVYWACSSRGSVFAATGLIGLLNLLCHHVSVRVRIYRSNKYVMPSCVCMCPIGGALLIRMRTSRVRIPQHASLWSGFFFPSAPTTMLLPDWLSVTWNKKRWES